MQQTGQVKWNDAFRCPTTLIAKTAQAKRRRRKSVDELLRRVDALPIIDPRTPDEILGYDENGLPR